MKIPEYFVNPTPERCQMNRSFKLNTAVVLVLGVGRTRKIVWWSSERHLWINPTVTFLRCLMDTVETRCRAF